MRLSVSILFLLASTASAQIISTIPLSSTQSMDGLYVDATGALYAMEGFAGSKVFRIMPDGELTVFADGVDGPVHMTRAPNGNFYATDFKRTSTSGEVSQITPDGTVSNYAVVPAGPSDIVSDIDGNLYVSHYGLLASGNGNRITRIKPGVLAVEEEYSVGGLLNAPVGLDFDDDGNLYAANIGDGRIVKIAPDGTQSLFASLTPIRPFTIGHLVWANGRLYATYLGGNQIYAFEPDGTGRVYAGTGEQGNADGSVASATLNRPNGITASVTGDTLFVSEYGDDGAPKDYLRMIVPAATSNETADASTLRALQLDAVYPSPFSASTTLRFTLGTPAEVTLEVYDMLGREVDRMEMGSRPAGEHVVAWVPRELPTGAYVLRLQTGDTNVVRSVFYHP